MENIPDVVESGKYGGKHMYIAVLIFPSFFPEKISYDGSKLRYFLSFLSFLNLFGVRFNFRRKKRTVSGESESY